jgi:predicted PurR-regulated permease PerM
VQLHAVVVLLAITLGSTLFGVIGAFLAVTAAAVSGVVLRYLNHLVTTESQPEPEASSAPEGHVEGSPG